MNTPLRLRHDIEFAGANFGLGSYKDARNQESPEYLMTSLGFSVLTMNTTELRIVIESTPCGA